MSVIGVIIAVVVVLVIVLAVVGYLLNQRRFRDEDAQLRERAREADHHLALAHAEDKGWERSGLEQAVREAYAQRHGTEPRDLMLVKVVDMPGVDEDEAVFAADGEEIVLTRRGGAWSVV